MAEEKWQRISLALFFVPLMILLLNSIFVGMFYFFSVRRAVKIPH